MAQTATQRSWLDRLWGNIADQGRAFARTPEAGLAGAPRAIALADLLLSEHGEASGAAVARDLIAILRQLAPDARLAVLTHISTHYTPDESRLREAAERYLTDPGPDAATRLHEAAEPPRQELLRRMNMAPGGTAMLVALRREMAAHLRTDPSLRPLDRDLLHLFASWFNRGFLELRRIDWETPASVLEKLITYEAVHEIDGWADLRRRLLPDRRCFAFFHQALPNDPLIFVEVALTRGLACAVQPLLAQPADPAGPPAPDADTAIFYSISNCQDGLRGVSFGNFLIKQVVEELSAELPQLRRFATLSPVPGFGKWLAAALHSPPPACGAPFTAEELGAPPEADLPQAFAQATEGAWWEDPVRAKTLRAPLLRAAAQYLTRETPESGPTDPVARFHLGNGARLERIDWQGNTAPAGLHQSFGIMVNYLYDRASIEANHEAFVNTGRVARSPEVDALAKPPAAAPLASARRAKQGAAKIA